MRSVNIFTAFAVMFLLLPAPPAKAEAKKLSAFMESQIEKRFKEADKNADGKLTLEEAEEGMPRVAKNFDKIDVQHKGYVTLDAIKTAAAAQ